MRALGPFVILAGCGAVSADKPDAANGDGPVEIDARVGACDLDAPFGSPVVVNGATNVRRATISYDELTIYYQDGADQMMRATRAKVTDAFGPGSAVPGVATTVYAPSQNQTETVLWVHDAAPKLHYLTRASTSDPFANLTNTNIDGEQVFASPDGLYWGSSGDLYRASLSGTTIGLSARIDSLATAEVENFPVASAGDHEIAFVRGTDLVVARRTMTGLDFTNATVVDVGMSPGAPAGFSGDRCRLYFTALVGSLVGLYMVARP